MSYNEKTPLTAAPVAQPNDVPRFCGNCGQRATAQYCGSCGAVVSQTALGISAAEVDAAWGQSVNRIREENSTMVTPHAASNATLDQIANSVGPAVTNVDDVSRQIRDQQQEIHEASVKQYLNVIKGGAAVATPAFVSAPVNVRIRNERGDFISERYVKYEYFVRDTLTYKIDLYDEQELCAKVTRVEQSGNMLGETRQPIEIRNPNYERLLNGLGLIFWLLADAFALAVAIYLMSHFIAEAANDDDNDDDTNNNSSSPSLFMRMLPVVGGTALLPVVHAMLCWKVKHDAWSSAHNVAKGIRTSMDGVVQRLHDIKASFDVPRECLAHHSGFAAIVIIEKVERTMDRDGRVDGFGKTEMGYATVSANDSQLFKAPRLSKNKMWIALGIGGRAMLMLITFSM